MTEQSTDLEVVSPGQLVVKNVCEVNAMLGVKTPPAWLGIVGAQAKQLFEGGFDVDEITAAAIVAIRRGKPQLTQSIAGDMALAAAGALMSNVEYTAYLAEHNALNKKSLLTEAKTKLMERSNR